MRKVVAVELRKQLYNIYPLYLREICNFFGVTRFYEVENLATLKEACGVGGYIAGAVLYSNLAMCRVDKISCAATSPSNAQR